MPGPFATGNSQPAGRDDIRYVAVNQHSSADQQTEHRKALLIAAQRRPNLHRGTILAVLLGPILVKPIERERRVFLSGRRDDHFYRDGTIQFRADTHRVARAHRLNVSSSRIRNRVSPTTSTTRSALLSSSHNVRSALVLLWLDDHPGPVGRLHHRGSGGFGFRGGRRAAEDGSALHLLPESDSSPVPIRAGKVYKKGKDHRNHVPAG